MSFPKIAALAFALALLAGCAAGPPPVREVAVGMNRFEVVEILGRPLAVDRIRTRDATGAEYTRFRYRTGTHIVFGPDGEVRHIVELDAE